MFHDDFERAWQILRGQGTVWDSQHVNVSLQDGSVINDARLYNQLIQRDDNGTILKREAVFMVGDDMRVVLLEDIAEMRIL